jgi:hypothetical protein
MLQRLTTFKTYLKKEGNISRNCIIKRKGKNESSGIKNYALITYNT